MMGAASRSPDGEELRKILGKVTYLITVRERCKHLRRALDYYSRFPIQAIVVDSSDRPCRIDRHPDRFKHLHLPQSFLVDAFSKALGEITTPYCVIASDDDFFIPRAVAASVDFLEKNGDFQSVQGLYGRFENDKNIELLEAYPHMPGYDVVAETSQERMIQHLDHYVTFYHAVHRTKHLRFAIDCGRPIKNFSANEIVTGSVTAMGGKLKVLPILYCIRETILTSQSSLLQRGKIGKVKFTKALSAPTEHRDLIQACENALCGALESRGLTSQDALASVRTAFDAYRCFVGEFPARSAEWQERMRQNGTPDFAQVLADPDTQKEWATIRSIVMDHDLSPYVPPLLVDDEGRRIRTWQDWPILFHSMVLLKKWSKARPLSRALASIRSALRVAAAR